MLLYDYVIGRSIGGSICDILLWEEALHQAPCLCRTLHKVGSIQCAVPRQIRASIIAPIQATAVERASCVKHQALVAPILKLCQLYP